MESQQQAEAQSLKGMMKIIASAQLEPLFTTTTTTTPPLNHASSSHASLLTQQDTTTVAPPASSSLTQFASSSSTTTSPQSAATSTLSSTNPNPTNSVPSNDSHVLTSIIIALVAATLVTAALVSFYMCLLRRRRSLERARLSTSVEAAHTSYVNNPATASSTSPQRPRHRRRHADDLTSLASRDNPLTGIAGVLDWLALHIPVFSVKMPRFRFARFGKKSEEEGVAGAGRPEGVVGVWEEFEMEERRAGADEAAGVI